ncbi:MAG: MFS transporter, partial [Elusimicrobia bacterium]|nr:MFS transporter [Elusimicrobiota bacterium]
PSARAAAPLAGGRAEAAPSGWPRYRYRAKTFSLLAALGGAGALLGVTVFGPHMLVGLVPAALFAFVPFWFSRPIVKRLMHDVPADESREPEYFAAVRGLLGRINAKRRARGLRALPMPELVDDPLPLPNAYATGRGPSRALVGVTAGLRELTLDPENVRAGVVRLISATDPGSKAFRVFRLAIAGSVPGAAEAADPAQLQAAVLKADRTELKALGVRMLTGVLAHELSHATDRHMLTGAIAGAAASTIAFSSYGMMWAVGHAQAALRRGVDRLLGRRAPAPDATPAAAGDGEGSRTLVADPVSLGAAVKSLPALLKLFAALWVPVLAQIVQMAASRGNEGMADEDGALLGGDPQALALALGLLTTWRPRASFALPGTDLPRVVALSALMTVNPVEQAHRSGALPRLDGFTEAVVGRGDDFLSDLFVTHPDTARRIERLADMAEVLKAAPPASADVSPAGPDGGGEAAPPPRAAPKPSLRARLGELLRVLPDEGRNRAFWTYTLGLALSTLGAYFHYTALPTLIAPTKADTDKLGYNRAANWAAQGASSVLTGPLVDRAALKPTLVWTYAGRALLMALVPVLFLTGHFGFAAFSLLIGLAGFLQATSQTAGSVAYNRILGDDESYYNRANAVSTIVLDAVGVVGPLLAGAFVAWIGTLFAAPLMGNALAYGVYAVLLLGAGVGYGLFLRLPRDGVEAARRGLRTRLKGADLAGARVRGVAIAREKGGSVLLVEAAGSAAALARAVPASFEGYPVRLVPPRSPLRELAAGLRLAFSNRFLRLYLLFSTLSQFSGDSLIFTVLPRYLSDSLHAGAGAFGILLAVAALGTGIASGLIALARDPAQAALAPVSRVFRAELSAREPGLSTQTLDLAAAALRESLPKTLERYKAERRAGGGRDRTPDELAADVLARAASDLAPLLKTTPESASALLEATGSARDVRLWAARRGARLMEGARRDADSGMDSLQRQGRWTNLLHAASWLAYAGVFLAHSFWPSAGLMLLSAVLAGPANVVWESLTTRVIAGAFPNDQGKVYGALTFYWIVCAAFGVLVFGWMLTGIATATALWIVAGVLSVCAVLDVLQTWRIFPIGRR